MERLEDLVLNFTTDFTRVGTGSDGEATVNISLVDADTEKADVRLYASLEKSLISIPAVFFTWTLLAVAISINIIVLEALYKVSRVELEAKHFLFMNILANLSVAIFMRLPHGILWLCFALHVEHPVLPSCLELLSWWLGSVTTSWQGFSALTLVFDRLYAVCFPLAYKTTGYSKAVISVVLFCQLFFSLCLLLPAIVIPFTIKQPPADLCTILIYGQFVYLKQARNIIMVAQSIAVFLVYIFIVFVLKCRNSVVKKSKSISKKSVSLVFVYLFIHVTSVLLYAPAPLYSFFFLQRVPTGQTAANINWLLTLIVVNAIFDPIVLTWKIPAIKRNVELIIGRRKLPAENKLQPSCQTGRTEVTAMNTG